ncbi:MAG: glycosyltransferase [Lentisphaerae bacterium]|nr:glycosyltransferase [Lentisphaerota bacterium]
MSSPAGSPQAVDLTVAVTCYNEQAFIADTLATVVQAARDAGLSYEVIVIDDVSQDASVERIRAFLQAHPDEPIRLVQNQINQGVGANFLSGALLGHGRYYRLYPGDDAEPRHAMAYIFKHVGCADLVIPAFDQDTIVGKSKFRRRLSKTFTCLVNGLSGFRLDYYNGLSVYRRENVLKWPPRTLGFGFQADIITRHLFEGVSYIHIPVKGMVEKKGQASTALRFKNVRSVMYAFAFIIGRRVRRLWRRDAPQPRAVVLARRIVQEVPGPTA